MTPNLRFMTRRQGLAVLCAISAQAVPRLHAQAPDAPVEMDALVFPPLDALEHAQQFGYKPPTPEEIKVAKEVLAKAPQGPTPISIAQWFVDNYKDNPKIISQWPAPAAWNPLVVEFFGATTTKATNDMIAWCAAFMNWCLLRTGRTKVATGSASSQSFMKSSLPETSTPNAGDIVVFTCYDAQGKSIGIGHVTFFKAFTDNDRILVVGGNQSADGYSSIISEKTFPTQPFKVRRHIGGKYEVTEMRLSRYLRVG